MASGRRLLPNTPKQPSVPRTQAAGPGNPGEGGDPAGWGRAQTLHIGIVRPTAAFRRDPDDVLGRILDVAGLAVHTVLRIDLQALGIVIVFDEFIDTSRAIAGFRPGVLCQINPHRYRGILQGQVYRLVFRMIGVGNEYR